jgi:carboxypeptidase PM20D1
MSMPPAHSAAGKLAAAVVQLENNPFAPRLVAPVEAMLAAAAPYTEFPNNLVLSNLWLTSSLVAAQMAQERTTSSFARTTTAVTILRAGVKENVIPQSAVAHVNFRMLPGDTPELVIAHVREVVKNPELDIEPAPGWGEPPPVAAMTGGGFAAIQQAVLAVHGDAVVLPFLLSGATDIRHYIDLADNHYRFHGTQIASAQTGGIHGTDEYIAVDSLDAAVDIAEQMLRAAN